MVGCQMNKCKRMTVTATGITLEGKIYRATNGNETECKNIPGECGCIHAEELMLRELPNPQIVVVSHSPCVNCARLLIRAGVRIVMYSKEYRIPDGIDLLRKNGVTVVAEEDVQ